MIREVGSEFWDVPVYQGTNGLFPENTKWFISGTAALDIIVQDIIQDNYIKTVALPSWCCSCMITPFLKYGVEVKFYPVYISSHRLICDYSTIEADCWLVLSYFGYTSQIAYGIPEGIVIRDLTHSIFAEKLDDADYFFGSLRKWAGFYTGGYAWSKKWNYTIDCPECDLSYISLRKNAMKQKWLYISEQNNSKEYLSLFEEGEEYLDRCEPMMAYSHDIEKAIHLNAEWLIKQRRKNAAVLLSGLREWALFPDLEENDCPLFVPILLDKKRRTELQNYLREHNVYCPIHWPIEKEHVLINRTKELYDQELSIVCDQRYDTDDMERILKTIFNSGVI